MRARFLAPVAACVIGAASCGNPDSSRSIVPTAPSQLVVAGRSYLVTLRNTEPSAFVRAHGIGARFVYSHALRGFAAELSADAIEGLAHNPNVVRIEPDGVVSLAAVQSPVDWGLDRIDQRALPLDLTYHYTADGAGVSVYIVDSGIRTTHVEFGGRAISAYTAINDGVGSEDCLGHGTHAAGIVGSTHHGVAKAVTLYAVRVFDCAGNSTYSGIVAAVDWITANRAGPSVVNMSLSGAISQTLTDAIQTSLASGVVYVVAAGNLGADACNYSPSNVPGAIAVGAISFDDARASFSNVGPCVDLFAPGFSILSTYNTSDTATARYSGTSMAAPFVAGAAALYLATHPGASPSDVSSGLTTAATASVLTGVPGGTANLLLFTGDSTTVVLPPPPPIDSVPVAAFTATCPRGGPCDFDASSSHDDHGIVSYTWDFGDGVTGSGVTGTHRYPPNTKKGGTNYTVRLTVTDAANQSSTVSKAVKVQ